MDEKYIFEMSWRYIFYCQSDEAKLQQLTYDRSAEMILSGVSDHVCQIAAFIKVYRAEIAKLDSDLFKGLKSAFFDMYYSYLSKHLACYHEAPVLNEAVGAIF